MREEVKPMAKKCGAKKKSASKKKAHYVCKVCGLLITVDSVCNCVEACDLICCGQEMELKKGGE
ncbi:MAG: hypothetical protein NC898_05580 [Candidatus Omnitrophica bacterium]|nr:hypothetical protein [Candidatus Omnitrophota bacterium]MCM8793913.1 hypothetical protein [Candidatus Omnitrophota bacterium]